MYLTTDSLSLIFFVFTIITLAFSLYFKVLVIKTSPDNKSRQKIIGDMKDPVTWRKKNNIMSYVSLFWAFASISLYIYLKFFYNKGVIYSVYLYIYIALIVFSIAIFSLKKKAYN